MNSRLFSLLAQANKTTSQDLFQHMQNEDPSSHDAQTLDSATADQAKEQEKAHFPDMHSDGEDEEEEEMKSALLEENDELPVSGAILQSNMSVMRGTRERGGGGGRLKNRNYLCQSLRIDIFSKMVSVSLAVCTKCYLK